MKTAEGRKSYETPWVIWIRASWHLFHYFYLDSHNEIFVKYSTCWLNRIVKCGVVNACFRWAKEGEGHVMSPFSSERLSLLSLQTFTTFLLLEISPQDLDMDWGIPRNLDRNLKKGSDKENRMQEHTFRWPSGVLFCRGVNACWGVQIATQSATVNLRPLRVLRVQLENP